MTKKLKQILTDTVVIIDAHEGGYWDNLCKVYKVAVPATIFENEAFYFQSDRGKKGLNPTEWLKQGKVVRIEAELEGLKALEKLITSDCIASLDAGELEALAILMSKGHRDTMFTTADKAAIKVLGVIGRGFQGISVEELLKEGGLRRKKNLPKHLTKKWFHHILAEGLSEQHLWLKSSSF